MTKPDYLMTGGPRTRDKAASDATSMMILDEYQAGGITQIQLAKNYGISERAIRIRMQKARAVKYGWRPDDL